MRAWEATVLVAGVLVVGTPTAWSFPDTYCTLNDQVDKTTVWTVNESTITTFLDNTGMDAAIDAAGFTAIVDQTLQTMARQGRHRVNARAVLGTCAVSGPTVDRPCIGAQNHDGLGPNGSNGGSVGLTTFVNGEAVFVLFWEEFDFTRYRDGTLDRTLMHELGHAYALAHVNTVPTVFNDCSDLNGARRFTCGGDENGGCGGELMCTVSRCVTAPWVSTGDGRGLRDNYTGTVEYSERFVYSGEASRYALDPQNNLRNVYREAAFQPRIDCSDTDDRCVAVVAEPDDGTPSNTFTKVVKLEGHLNPGWSTNSAVSDLPTDMALAPDVAISSDGNTALVVMAKEKTHTTIIYEVNMNSTNGYALASLDYKSTIPPRVTWSERTGRFLILGRKARTGVASNLCSSSDPECFASPRFILHAYNPSGNVLSTPGFGNFNNTGFSNTHQVGSEYDFDCDYLPSGTERCALVLTLPRSDEAGAQDPSSMAYVLFTPNISGSSISISGLPSTFQRIPSITGLNGVVGVSYDTDSNDLFVSMGNRLTGVSSNQNTQIKRFYVDTLGSNQGNQFDTVFSDVDICTSDVGDGGSIEGPAHGGYDIAWSRVEDRLFSMHFGKEESGGTFCY